MNRWRVSTSRSDSVGKNLETGWSSGGISFGGEIIGIVGDVRQFLLKRDMASHMYMYMYMMYTSAEQMPFDEFDVVIKSTLAPDLLFSTLRPMLRAIDAAFAMNDARPMSSIVDALHETH